MSTQNVKVMNDSQEHVAFELMQFIWRADEHKGEEATLRLYRRCMNSVRMQDGKYAVDQA